MHVCGVQRIRHHDLPFAIYLRGGFGPSRVITIRQNIQKLFPAFSLVRIPDSSRPSGRVYIYVLYMGGTCDDVCYRMII